MAEKSLKLRVQLLWGLSTSLTALSTVAVVLRIIGRRLMSIWKLGADDWTMIVGWAFNVGYVAQVLYITRVGTVGHHTSTLSKAARVGAKKSGLRLEVSYPAALCMVKVSIMLFYLRLAVTRRFYLLCWGSIVLLVVLLIVDEVLTLVQCVPLKKVWDITKKEPGVCKINRTTLFYVYAGCNVLIDIWILVLPLKMIFSIRRPRNDKIGLGIIFGLFSMSLIAGAVRLYSIRVYTQSKDPSYDSIPINIWSVVEINTAIICASAPAIKPIYNHLRGKRATSSYNRPMRSLATILFSSSPGADVVEHPKHHDGDCLPHTGSGGASSDHTSQQKSAATEVVSSVSKVGE